MSSPQAFIQPSDLKHLAENGFVVVEDFLPNEHIKSYRLNFINDFENDIFSD